MQNYARRRFLKGLGTTLALPYLPSVLGDVAANAPTQRMIFIAFGWGVTQETWLPKRGDVGPNYQLPEGLAPLAKHKKDFSIIMGSQHQFNLEGHWGSTVYLTGANRYAVPGKSFTNSVSADQIAAQAWGKENRYSSLQFDTENASESGHGPGLSLSWNQSGKPMAGVQNPFDIYQKLFGNEEMSVEQRQRMIRRKGSSLDAILSDAKQLQGKLNVSDKDKLDEYFESVREIELQLAKEEAWLDRPKPKAPFETPKEGLKGYEEIKLTYDLMVAALQTNSTRVITYRQPVESLLQSMNVGISSHNMSHYGGGIRREVSEQRDLKQSELLSYLLDKLKLTKDMDGRSLLETTTLSYGSNILHGHTLNNCPVIVAGNSKHLKLGEHVELPSGTPLCNLWLTLLNANQLDQERFGDSEGMIDRIMV